MSKLRTTVLAGFMSLIDACSFNKIYLPETVLYDPDNKKVEYSEHPNNSHGASTYYNELNRPIISYNPQWLGRFPEEFQTFLIFHEYGHIMKGHLNQNPYTMTEEQFNKNQYEADCYSIKKLKTDFNYSKLQLGTVYDWAFLTFETQRRVDNLMRCF